MPNPAPVSPLPAVPPSAPPADAPPVRLLEVSRWYGEVLGIDKVTVDIQTGITGLVGPNGSGKSTLMNLVCGLLRPGRGTVRVFGQPVWNNLALRRRMGYCTQVDHFFEDFSGVQFLETVLGLHGRGRQWAADTAREALARVHLAPQQNRRIRGYSKGMRQRVKIALALAHQPDLLVLDEPFNGLDPVGRHEMMQIFADYAREGRTVLISSHILHEIERMTDRILMMSNGHVMAEGGVRDVRDALRGHPFRVVVRCREPRRLAALLIADECVRSARMEADGSVTFSTLDPDRFYLLFNDLVVRHGLEVDLVVLADENVQSIYDYLAGKEHH